MDYVYGLAILPVYTMYSSPRVTTLTQTLTSCVAPKLYSSMSNMVTLTLTLLKQNYEEMY